MQGEDIFEALARLEWCQISSIGHKVCPACNKQEIFDDYVGEGYITRYREHEPDCWLKAAIKSASANMEVLNSLQEQVKTWRKRADKAGDDARGALNDEQSGALYAEKQLYEVCADEVLRILGGKK